MIAFALTSLSGCNPAAPPDSERVPVAEATPDDDPFRFFTVWGFEAKTTKGREGLEHILGGTAIPFPLPLQMARGTAALSPQDPLSRWRIEGAVPNPFQEDPVLFVGLGDAVYEENDVTLVSKTCFQCHAGTVGGQIVAGIASTHTDVSQPLWTIERLIETSSGMEGTKALAPLYSAVRTLDLKALEYYRDFKIYGRETFVPPLRNSSVRGDNHGPYSVWWSASKIAEPLESGIVTRTDSGDPRTAEYEALLDVPMPTIDALPWWNIKFKERAYWFWDAPGHAANAFNLNFYTYQYKVDSADNLEAHNTKMREKVAIIEKVVEYARETESPPWPKGLDYDLVERGRALYHDEDPGIEMGCVECHGAITRDQYHWTVAYPNRGLQNVDTDPEYNNVLQHLAPLAKRINATRPYYDPEVGPFSYEVTEPGYMAPVLVGLWASAPYLHNGAVPTLDDLFRPPDERPLIWGRVIDDPAAYDYERVGLAYDTITGEGYAQLQTQADGAGVQSEEALQLRRFYPTAGFGRSAAGHDYGTDLNHDDRQALIEFLKSVSGPDVTSANPIKRWDPSMAPENSDAY